MLRLGLISAATYKYLDKPRQAGSHHGTAFATTFNGWDEEKAKQFEWTFIRANRCIEGARVVKVWDVEREWAERLADVCSIENVCDSPDQCAQDVDAAIIVDDGSCEQYKYAEAPLRAGIPTFCDKPLAITAKEAKYIADISHQTGTPLMSASSLRFIPDILKLRDEFRAGELGDVNMATTICGNELVYYGIHALSMAYAVFGGGAVSCVNVGKPGRNMVRVRYECGRDLLLMSGEAPWMRGGYNFNLYGTKDWRVVQPNLENLYTYLLEAFMALLTRGEVSVPIDEEVEVIAVLEAGKRSLEEGREVTIDEVLAG